MDKKGMKRPDPEDYKGEKKQHFENNDVPPVPELQGKAKHTKEKANPVKYEGKHNTVLPDDEEENWL
ncbi:MAG: hypothetical protein N2376_03590 [Clostridia bacterium]|nr:hypothetical protein [Clostridia bacterium]